MYPYNKKNVRIKNKNVLEQLKDSFVLFDLLSYSGCLSGELPSVFSYLLFELLDVMLYCELLCVFLFAVVMNCPRCWYIDSCIVYFYVPLVGITLGAGILWAV